MNTLQTIDFKNSLKQKCIAIIKERITACNKAMKDAQDAANKEEKSSAGDKYETGRAMSHLEKDMHARQLMANQKNLADVYAVNCNTINATAIAGSVIECETCSFFIASGLGKIMIDDKMYFLLSPHAPIAQLLLNKKCGDTITFLKETFKIINIY